MRAGSLRQRIQIQKDEATRSPTGEIVHAWRTVHTCWANIRYPTGKEYSKEMITANKEAVRTWFSVRIRKVPGLAITSDMRVMMDGQAYGIRAVLPSLSSLDLSCSQVV